MIKITKVEEPTVLKENAAKWTKIIQDHTNGGTRPTDTDLSRYNHADIKTALKRETHGKCAYCEAKFEHISYGDVEHIVPKKNDAGMRFSWSNLTLACDVCNTNKGAKSDIIDPYDCDPETRFYFLGAMMFPVAGDPEATLTEIGLKLNRAKLVERRAERIKRIYDVISLALRSNDSRIKEAILTDLKVSEVGSDQEFAAAARSFIKDAETRGLV